MATTGATETIATAKIGMAVAMVMQEDMGTADTTDGTTVGSPGRTLAPIILYIEYDMYNYVDNMVDSTT